MSASVARPPAAWSPLRLRGAVLVYLIGAWFLDIGLAFHLSVHNLLLTAGCLLATAIAIIKRVEARRLGISILSQDWIYLAYIIFALATAAWAPATAGTVVGAIFLIAVWLAAVNLGEAELTSALRIIIRLAFVTALLSFALVPVSPQLAFQPLTSTAIPELRGIFAHQLRLGLFMSIALGVAIVGFLNGDLRKLLGGPIKGTAMLLAIGVCMIAAFARLYTGAMLLALALTVGLAKPGWLRRFTVLCLLATVGAIVAAVFYYTSAVAMFVVSSDADLTLTGRTLIWERTLSVIPPGHWLGFGYASFDHSSFDPLFPYYRPAHPHNSYIQAYFETGYIGLLLTLLLIVAHFRVALRVSRTLNRYSYSLFLVLLTTIGSLTGSNYAGKPTFLVCVLLLVLAMEAREARRRRAPPRRRPSARAGARRVGRVEDIPFATRSSGEWPGPEEGAGV